MSKKDRQAVPESWSNRRHRKSGHCGKGPALRREMKREAEANEIRDKSRIKNPKTTVKELFE
jgi:hypothetical protein